jgi:hypothetical protein
VGPLRFGDKLFRFDAQRLDENTDGACGQSGLGEPADVMGYPRRGRRAVGLTGGSARPVGSRPALMPPRVARFEKGRGLGAEPPQTPVADKCQLPAGEITWRLVMGEYSGVSTAAAYHCIDIRSRNLPVVGVRGGMCLPAPHCR